MMNKKNLDKEITLRNIEIYELEEKIKELNKYKVLYFIKQKEINKIKDLLKNNLELLPDQVKFNLKNLLDELSGIKYN